MKTTYTKLILQDGQLVAVPADYAERHELVRVEHPLLAKPLIVAAYGLPKLPWKEAIAAAEKHTVYGLPMRAPTVEEAFFIPDRSQYSATPKLYFPDIEDGWWTWTSTVDAEDPEDTDDTAGYAWYVGLSYGLSNRLYQSYRYHVRAVCAGQF
jgi:hypothetical protein